MWTPSSLALRPPTPHRAGALFCRPRPPPRLRPRLRASGPGADPVYDAPKSGIVIEPSGPAGARVVGDLPDVAVWIPETAGVTAVEGLPGRLRYLGPGGCRFGQHPINLGPRPDVVRQDDAAEAIAIAVLDTRVAGQLVACPEDHRHASGLEEHRLLGLLAPPAQPLVKRPGPVQVGDSQRDQADPLLHPSNLTHVTWPISCIRGAATRQRDMMPVKITRTPLLEWVRGAAELRR